MSVMSPTGAETIDAMILQDHRTLRSHFQQWQLTGDVKWYNMYLFDLCRHSIAEELVFYPLIDNLDSKLSTIDRKQHNEAKEAAAAIEKMQRPSAEFTAAFTKLFNDVDEHMKKEELEDIPLFQRSVSQADRMKYGKSFELRKKIVPTRPHTGVPNESPAFEEAMGLLLAPIDKFRDLFRDYPKEVTAE